MDSLLSFRLVLAMSQTQPMLPSMPPNSFRHLPSTFLLLLLSLIAIHPASADFIIVQKGEGAQISGDLTIRIKESKVRADLAAHTTILADAATGDSLVVNHKDKNYTRMNAASTRSMLEQFAPAGGNAAANKPVATGQMEKIQDWESEIFTWTGPLLTAKFWVARKFPNYEKLGPALARLQAVGGPLGTQGLLPSPSEFPGMIVKQELNVFGQKMSTTLVSVEEKDVPANVFNLPTNYKEVAAPKLDPAPAK